MTKYLIQCVAVHQRREHLGNLAGSLCRRHSARFRRQAGDDVLFLCGTDEHGTAGRAGRSAPKGSPLPNTAHASTRFRPTSIAVSASRSTISRGLPEKRTVS